MSPVRIVLADDHTLVRAGIRSLVESIDGVEVVAECGDGRVISSRVSRQNAGSERETPHRMTGAASRNVDLERGLRVTLG